MSQIVGGIAASHSTLMNTHWAEVDHLQGPHRFREGLDRAREMVAELRPDAIVVIGSNHFRGLFLDLMPSITVGVAEVLGAGEAGTPEGPLPVDRELAKRVVDGLVDEGFDPAFSLRLTVDHGITHSLQYLVPDLDIPIVPVIINMFAPPLIGLPRAAALGAAIGAAARSDEADKRVLVIASGGLSHRLPWPDWSQTLSDDDRFLVEAWLHGRTQWKEFEVRRREIIRAAEPDLNPDFDRDFLAQLERGDLSEILSWSNDKLEEVAGNGAQEIRSWIAMTTAVGPGRGRTLAYEPIDEWLTGMGVASFEPTQHDPA
ncbi:catechol 1,2-dioxygenase [Aeromicrobium piscarium]|uniref:Catechol 1,2-dioxygenase n=1 Tax=Aeromicrobium piscarium TaxID=2590901 RepID=A0A554SD76_9ACTN|nr:catechol 1,2-dioxygenase [Aeromicrobium piscarium]TSD64299.1 catechol 1,2-dioxygenase [Aeromicrobium piscarium]